MSESSQFANLPPFLRKRIEKLPIEKLKNWGIKGYKLYECYSIPIALGMGLFTVFMTDRYFTYVRWLMLYLLGIWGIFVIWNFFGREFLFKKSSTWFERGELGFTVVTQNLYNEIQLFILPFYWFSTTLSSPNMVFFTLLLLVTLASTIDPIYENWVMKKPWLTILYYGLTFFFAMNFMLPVLVGLRNEYSVYVSAVIAVVFPILLLREHWVMFRSRAKAIRSVILVAVIAGIFTAFVGWVPPAPMRVVHEVMTTSMDKSHLAPVDTLHDISTDDLESLTAFTAVFAPHGIKDEIFHEWYYKGDRIDRIPLKIKGGRKEGFRTYSTKRNFPADPTGSWRVDVKMSSGQLIGRMWFKVKQG